MYAGIGIKDEAPDLIPQRANKTGSMVDMSFLWVRNTALRKALASFRVTVPAENTGRCSVLPHIYLCRDKGLPLKAKHIDFALSFSFSCDLNVFSGLHK